MAAPSVNIDFAQVREHLRRRRRELTDRAQRVRRDLDRVEGALSPDFSEQAAQTQNDATLSEIGRSAAEQIRAIDAALIRLEYGEYGLCRLCERPIEIARLTALPEAVTCAKCAS